MCLNEGDIGFAQNDIVALGTIIVCHLYDVNFYSTNFLNLVNIYALLSLMYICICIGEYLYCNGSRITFWASFHTDVTEPGLAGDID